MVFTIYILSTLSKTGVVSRGLYSDGDTADRHIHGRRTHGDVMLLTMVKYFLKTPIHPLFKAELHVRKRYLVALGFLGVFQVGNKDSAGVAENVRDDENPGRI